MSPIVFNCHSKVNDLLPPSKLFENLKAVRSLFPDHQALYKVLSPGCLRPYRHLL